MHIEKKIKSDLRSVEKMKEDFKGAGVSQFGSGWCWLAVKDGKIVVMKTPNGENPLVHDAKPILGCDVWELSVIACKLGFEGSSRNVRDRSINPADLGTGSR